MNSNEENQEHKHDHHHHHHHGGRGRRCGRFLFIVPFIALAILAKSALVMLLWNALIPELFHGPEVTYLQALGLMVLAKLLVGFHGFRRWGHHGFGRRGPWMMHMSPEEREKLREEFRRRCVTKE